MAKIYTIKVNDSITFGDAFFVSYNAPKLVLRLSANSGDKISLLRSHAAEPTQMTFQLESRGNTLEVLPKFRAQLTSADQPPLHFELTLLDSVDLSGLD